MTNHNGERLARYKEKLLEKSRELGRRAIAKDEIAIERNAEILDEIQRTTEREMAMTLLTRNWETAFLVRDALDRIASGTFGVCESCDQPIGEKRLQAIPWSKLCIHCQNAADIENQLDWGKAA